MALLWGQTRSKVVFWPADLVGMTMSFFLRASQMHMQILQHDWIASHVIKRVFSDPTASCTHGQQRM